jgi:hypothetical protein
MIQHMLRDARTSLAGSKIPNFMEYMRREKI